MRTLALTRPLSVKIGLMLVLFLGSGATIAATRGNSETKRTPPPSCKFKPPAVEQPIELPDEVDKLSAGCIDAIAASQDEGVVTTQPDVPADPTCSTPGGVVTVVTTAYKNTGHTSYLDYGVGSGKRRGYVVAKIRNMGACATADPVSIPAGTTVYWVIEFKAGGPNANARLIVAGGSDVPNHAPKFRFHNCGNNAEPEDDKAWFKFGKVCSDQLHTVASLAASRRRVAAQKADFPRSPHRATFDPPPFLWMACGGDCCVTDQ
jgi:hypothetical protein